MLLRGAGRSRGSRTRVKSWRVSSRVGPLRATGSLRSSDVYTGEGMTSRGRPRAVPLRSSSTGCKEHTVATSSRTMISTTLSAETSTVIVACRRRRRWWRSMPPLKGPPAAGCRESGANGVRGHRREQQREATISSVLLEGPSAEDESRAILALLNPCERCHRAHRDPDRRRAFGGTARRRRRSGDERDHSSVRLQLARERCSRSVQPTTPSFLGIPSSLREVCVRTPRQVVHHEKTPMIDPEPLKVACQCCYVVGRAGRVGAADDPGRHRGQPSGSGDDAEGHRGTGS